MPKAILTDIEGTTSSISFVKDVLFPYARRALPGFVAARGSEPEVRRWLDAVAAELGGACQDDLVVETNGLKLFVDPFSMQYLGGVEIDYVSTFQGSGFTFNNPNATGGCGCGSSFTA